MPTATHPVDGRDAVVAAVRPAEDVPPQPQAEIRADDGRVQDHPPQLDRSQVTCVIPYAGAQKYIHEAVELAVSQGFVETLIVNDGCDPKPLMPLAGLRGVRILNLPKPLGCAGARNAGIEACGTPYIVFLDHDDLLCPGYFDAISDWLLRNKLRCAAATLRYIGENSRRVGLLVSRQPEFLMPSGFLAEISLVQEAGMFPDSYSDDVLFFRSVRKLVRLTTCPGAGVLYRIHPQAESSRNTSLVGVQSAVAALRQRLAPACGDQRHREGLCIERRRPSGTGKGTVRK